MRRLTVSLVACLAIFAWASPSRAATVDIRVTLQPGTDSWYLEVNSVAGVQVGGIALVVSDSLGSFTQFLPPSSNPPICVLVLGGCEPFPPAAPTGYHAFQFVLGTAPAGFPLLPFSGLIGAFSSQPGPIQVLPGDDLFGATAFDTVGTPLDYSIEVVPEPGVTSLLLLAVLAGALRLTRP